MTEWVLITMMCFRNCSPQFAEIYPNKAACMERIKEPLSAWALPTNYCVPLIKEKK